MSHQEPFEAQTVVCPQCSGLAATLSITRGVHFAVNAAKKLIWVLEPAEDYRMGNTPSEASEDELPPAALH